MAKLESLTAITAVNVKATDLMYLAHSTTYNSRRIVMSEVSTFVKTQEDFLSSASIAAAYLTSASAASAYQPVGDYVTSASLATTLGSYTTSNSVSAAIAQYKTSNSISALYVSMANRQLTGGYWSNITNDGTVSTGSYIPFTARTGTNFRRVVNGGAFTLTPPTATSSAAIVLSVLVVNAATGAGAITTTPFTDVSGDSFDTTANNEFLCRIDVFHDGSAQYSALNVVALQ